MDTWLPTGPHARRTFLAVAALGAGLLLAARFAGIPWIFSSGHPKASDAIDETLGNLFATLVAGTGLAAVLLWLFPPPSRAADVESLPPHEISRALERAMPTTSRWWYDGSTGRYQRSTTLPELTHLARTSGTSRDVTLVILDVTDDSLCQQYANYRGGVSPEGSDWSVERVRRDLYATILAAHIRNHAGPLNVSLALKGHLSLLRYDLSDSQLVVTKEGATDPAIRLAAGSFFYDAYLEQLRWNLKQARTVDLSHSREAP